MPPPPTFSLPLPYRLFFLSIEPISTIIGAYYAHYRPVEYLQLTHLPSSPNNTDALATSTTVVLSQLANLYLLFAINEALVLRSTSDLRVWRTLLFGLLLADIGHLYSVKELGWGVYVRLFLCFFSNLILPFEMITFLFIDYVGSSILNLLIHFKTNLFISIVGSQIVE